MAGIEVGNEDGYVKVIAPIGRLTSLSQAFRSPGDVITRIDSVVPSERPGGIDDAVKRLRGEPNTKITLTIAREETQNKPVVCVSLVQELIKQHSVKAKVVEPGLRVVTHFAISGTNG